MNAVIFDMDGVLIDTEKHLIECWMQAAKMHGVSMKREEAYLLRSLTGTMAAPMLHEMYGEEFDYWTVRETRKKLMEKRLAEYGIERKKGVVEALEMLKKKGFKVAIATATDSERAKGYLEKVGILSYFDYVISANMVSIGKPMPDIYLYACEKIGEKPENCYAVEDSPNGVMSAYRAGMKVIMVPDLTQPDPETEQRLYAKIDSLEDLYKFV